MLGRLWGSLVGGPVVTAAEGIAGVIDRFVETDDEKQAAALIKAKLMLQPSLAQIELNKIEAGHRSLFVAGWRPFIGWVCGWALVWHFILHDLLMWLVLAWSPTATVPELAGTETLVTIVLSLLGLGALRTAEKMAGKAM